MGHIVSPAAGSVLWQVGSVGVVRPNWMVFVLLSFTGGTCRFPFEVVTCDGVFGAFYLFGPCRTVAWFVPCCGGFAQEAVEHNQNARVCIAVVDNR